MNTKILLIVILAVALGGVVVWKLSVPRAVEQEAPESQPSITPKDTVPSDAAGDEGMPVARITIEGDEFSFSPAGFSVSRGQTVEMTFKNVGAIPHNYTISELGLATRTIGGGKTDTVTFTAPDSPGTISYASFCSVPGHREAGMVGTLEIK